MAPLVYNVTRVFLMGSLWEGFVLTWKKSFFLFEEMEDGRILRLAIGDHRLHYYTIHNMYGTKYFKRLILYLYLWHVHKNLYQIKAEIKVKVEIMSNLGDTFECYHEQFKTLQSHVLYFIWL